MQKSVLSTFKAFANNRYRKFFDSSIREMLWEADEFRVIPEDYAMYLSENRYNVLKWFDLWSSEQSVKIDTLQFFVENTLRYFYTKNQYLDILPHNYTQLLALYQKFLEDYRQAVKNYRDADELHKVISKMQVKHHQRLSNFVYGLADINGNLDFVLHEPICHFYQVELQLMKLHIDIDELAEPILDLGCGQDGQLVQYLRQEGKEAYGIDRMANPNSYIKRLGWFEFDIGEREWGTVISHMAFSNHFIHHHLREDSHYVQYAKSFMKILQSLKVGGLFIYTPGLPFIETLLPVSQYDVKLFGTENGTHYHALYTAHIRQLRA